MKRYRMSKRSSRRNFRKNAGSHRKNTAKPIMRGGYRI